MAERMGLTEVIDHLDDKANGDTLTLNAVLDAVGNRGYGPLLLAASLVEILPTGVIPGVPTLVALTVIIFAAQLVFGRPSPWVPEKLGTKGLNREKFERARKKVKPVTQKLDILIKPRWPFFVSSLAARLVGVICILMALTMPPLEIIPFAGYIPAVAIAFLALGLTGHDGLVIAIGCLVASVGLGAGAYWLLA